MIRKTSVIRKPFAVFAALVTIVAGLATTTVAAAAPATTPVRAWTSANLALAAPTGEVVAAATPALAAPSITKSQAKMAFKKFAKAAKSGSLKATRKHTTTKGNAKKAIKYFDYLASGNIVSEKKTVSCYKDAGKIACGYMVEQQVGEVSFTIIQQVSAVAKRVDGKIVFKKVSYANNLG